PPRKYWTMKLHTERDYTNGGRGFLRLRAHAHPPPPLTSSPSTPAPVPTRQYCRQTFRTCCSTITFAPIPPLLPPLPLPSFPDPFPRSVFWLFLHRPRQRPGTRIYVAPRRTPPG